MKVKMQSLRGSKQSLRGWTLKMKAWILEIDPRRVYKLVVADSHHFDLEQDLDMDPHSLK